MFHKNEDEQLKLENYIITAHEGDIIIETLDGGEVDYLPSVDFYNDISKIEESRAILSLQDIVTLLKWYFELDDDLEAYIERLSDRLNLAMHIQREEMKILLKSIGEEVSADIELNSYTGVVLVFTSSKHLSCKELLGIEEAINLPFYDMTETINRDVVYNFKERVR